jgi:hypothetical protein
MHQFSGHSPLVLAALIAIFAMPYAAIALEHPLKINRSGSALVGAGLLWTIYALSVGDARLVSRLALVGYLAGAGVFLVQRQLLA